MLLTFILLVIVILLIIVMIINQRNMQQKLESEKYSKEQLVTKISFVTRENTQLKNQMLHFDGNNDTNHHGLRKAKQNLNDILEQYKTSGVINAFDIIATGNLAVKHPLFEYARAFDYIVITDKGVFNINVKNWKQKTFYHFDVNSENEVSNSNETSLNQTVGRYIAQQYHSQFNTTRTGSYTFIERVKNNSVIYDFYSYDPFEQTAKNTKELEAAIAEKSNHKISNIGLVYFTDGSVNIIDGPNVREDYTETVSSKSSLKEVIGDTLTNANESLSEEQYNKLVERFH
ncbi:hypothetical protein MHZ36_09715 [Staphylococcus sp. ACRSN]|uniref:hypothetical protein n=1 Tax=Staphylococcus sp. ACRSN TaxID=2918214 RepID=UPI001EF2E01F|nr:hypothetical protein [Staphylococcus sp. ACRSN]MCG7339568.1 hypothetical protein [Staphylococcus sp. ACRSN]